MFDFKNIKLELQNGIAILTLHRPEALNALNNELLSELDHALTVLGKKDFSEFRVLVLTGAGEKAFVAGADIKEISQLSPQSATEFAKKGQSVFRKLENLQVPVIAAVNGFALGGGLELALSCDFIYASSTAKFGLPEVTLGLIPGFGGTVRLSKVVGINFAREMILTGNMLSASEAQSSGLVNKVTAPEELLPIVQKIAETISLRGPVAVKTAKKSVLQTFDQDVETAMATEAILFSSLFSTQDVKEGTGAFLEKRKAQFKGE